MIAKSVDLHSVVNGIPAERGCCSYGALMGFDS